MSVKSKYEENTYTNGHTTVWGSFFHKGAWSWGYADDHSLLKNSYNTGANGRAANDASNSQRFGTGAAGSGALESQRAMLKATAAQAGGETLRGAVPDKRSELYGDADKNVELDAEKLKAAIAKEEEFQRRAKEGGGGGLEGDKKRKYNSMESTEVTKEEMEAYRLTKAKENEFAWKEGELLEYKK